MPSTEQHNPEQDAQEDEQATVECHECGADIPENDAVEAPDGELYCEGCTATCEDCGETVRDSMVHYRNGYAMCEDCADNYVSCYSCNDDIHVDSSEYVDDEHFCSTCAAEARRGSDVIGRYHSSEHTPVYGEWSRANGRRLFGVELEVEADSNPEGRAEAIQAAVEAHIQRDYKGRTNTYGSTITKLLSMEEDGSLDNGFEMISCPLGLDDQRVLWDAILTRENVRGLKSHMTDTCGLHVHVSREGIKPLNIGKLQVFLNLKENERLIRAISRRYDGSYCRVKYKTVEDTTGFDRYEMLNLTNSRTIEFRIFKGSLRKDAVLAAIEFAHAATEFCREDSPYGMDFSTTSFMHFIHTDARMLEDAVNLRKYLASRGLSLDTL